MAITLLDTINKAIKNDALLLSSSAIKKATNLDESIKTHLLSASPLSITATGLKAKQSGTQVLVAGTLNSSVLNVDKPPAQAYFSQGTKGAINFTLIIALNKWTFQESFDLIDADNPELKQLTIGASAFWLLTDTEHDQTWSNNKYTYKGLTEGLNTFLPKTRFDPVATPLGKLGIDISKLQFQGPIYDSSWGTFYIEARSKIKEIKLFGLELTDLALALEGLGAFVQLGEDEAEEGSEKPDFIDISTLLVVQFTLKGGKTIKLEGTLPYDASGNWDNSQIGFYIEFDEGNSKGIGILDLATSMISGLTSTNLTDVLPASITDKFNDFEVDAFQANCSISPKKLKSVNVVGQYLPTADKFNLIPDVSFIKVESLTLNWTIYKGPPNKIDFVISGDLGIGTKGSLKDYHLKFSGTSEKVFKGGLAIREGAKPKGLKLSDLLSNFGLKASENTWLPEGTIDNLNFTADLSDPTKSSYDLEFKVGLQWASPGDAGDLALDVKLSVEKESSYTASLSATIDIGTATIQLDASKSDATKIIATYTGEGVGFNNLIHVLDLNAIPSALDIQFKELTLGFAKGEKNVLFVSGTTTGGNQAAFVVEKGPGKEGHGTGQTTYGFGAEYGKDVKESLGEIPVVGDFIGDKEIGAKDFKIIMNHGFENNVDWGTIFSGHDVPGSDLLSAITSGKHGIGIGATFFVADFSKEVLIPIYQPPANGGINPAKHTTPALVLAKGGDEDTNSSGTIPGEGTPPGTNEHVQQMFGPIRIDRVTLKFDVKKEVLGIVIDGALVIGNFEFDLLGLYFGFNIKEGTPEVPSLEGMLLAYESASLTLEGAFMAEEVSGGKAYNGLINVKAENYGLYAIGSFGQFPNPKGGGNFTSMFLFAMLDAVLGGPPFFVVEGLAGGFGYNNHLELPAVDEIVDYPLIQGAEGQGGFEMSLDKLSDDFEKFSNYMKVVDNDFWVAAGIKFNTFNIIDTFALATLSFGKDFEIGLLGLSNISVPYSPDGSTPTIAKAGLELKVDYRPTDGILQAAAQLTENSYIFDPACHIQGGFAFYTWFKDQDNGAKAGDYVITLGGYSRAFKAPDYYPSVPRLGMNWHMGNVSLKSRLYYAVAPHYIMAGGSMNAVWQKGDFKAWFDVEADFLIHYQPFHYNIDCHIDLGASVDTHIGPIHISVSKHIGVDINLYGPKLGGTAHVDLSVISFTVDFGDPPPSGDAIIPWDSFETHFLKPKKKPTSDLVMSVGDASQSDYLNVIASKGVVGKSKGAGTGNDNWILNANGFELQSDSKIPAQSAIFGSKSAITNGFETPAVRPVGVKDSDFTSKHTVEIICTKDGLYGGVPSKITTKVQTLLSNGANLGGFPTALWGKPSDNSYNQKRVLKGCKGLIIGTNLKAGDQTKKVNVELLLESEVKEKAIFSSGATPVTSNTKAWKAAKNTQRYINSHCSTIEPLFKANLTALGSIGFDLISTSDVVDPLILNHNPYSKGQPVFRLSGEEDTV